MKNVHLKIAILLLPMLLIAAGLSAQNIHYTLAPSMKYMRISPFSEGVAKVQINADSTGYIDQTGKLLFGGFYDESSSQSFHDGLAAVAKTIYNPGSKDGFYLLKQQDSKEESPTVLSKQPFIPIANFDLIDRFWVYNDSKNVLRIALNAKATTKLNNWLKNNPSQSLALVLNGNKISTAPLEGLVDRGVLYFKDLTDRNLDEILYPIKDHSQTKYGYVNRAGKVIIPFIYDEVEDFSDGYALVYGDYWHIIDKKGNEVFQGSPLITEMHNNQGGYDVEPPSFHDGLMQVRQDEKYGFMNTKGKIVIPCQYKSATDFSDGVAMVYIPQKTKNKARLGEGNSVLDSIYRDLPGQPDEQAYHWAFINKKGEILYRFTEDKTPDLTSGLHEGTIIFYVDDPHNGFRKRYGIINGTGQAIVPAQYTSLLWGFSDGVALTQIQGQKSDNSDGYILMLNKEGEKIGKTTLDTPYGLMYNSQRQFHEGLMAVQIGTEDGMLWGYINKQGQFVIRPQFRNASNFSSGVAVVVTTDGKVGVLKHP